MACWGLRQDRVGSGSDQGPKEGLCGEVGVGVAETEGSAWAGCRAEAETGLPWEGREHVY